MLLTARAWGVSPSRFLGLPETVVQYDLSGNVVGTLELPGWSADDRMAALELAGYEASLCGGCQHPLDETTRPENEYAYRAGLPIRCHRCTAMAMASDKAQSLPHPSALMIPIELVSRAGTEG